MNKICGSCCFPKILKKLVDKRGCIGRCSVCHDTSSKVIDTTSLQFIKTIKGLLRYFYSESEYHRKLGGDSFEHHLSEKNPIFRIPPNMSSLDKEEFLLSFLQDLNSDDQITLFTAYGRDIYNYVPMTSVSVGSSSVIEKARYKLTYLNYYQVEDEFESRFASLVEHIKAPLKVESEFYRARIGSRLKASNFDWKKMRHEEEFHEAYQGKDIGAPPIHLASGGRINRPGVSYLYLASDADTAISEVRPHPGENVSVGRFKSNVNLQIADFSQHELTEELLSDEGLDILELIIAIENTLSVTVSPSMNKQYNITQFIAEIVRKLSFDGLAFKSSVGTGKNYVLFNPESFDWVEGSDQVFKVSSVSYKTEPQKKFDEQEYYDRTYEETA
ncbi:RES family NAD+ phosphorylase [Vibrio parahaemolyticus]|uniref:RES family NAD+ phosphorylase n=1 Tax=Vibrio parahaemolyticus TaxID=670 RepID=UPI0006A71ECC|nr:RES family NAD+ phosphorylase [Vibrio parahaemolyticus]EGQ8287433.1 RES domain-containing protein [Vibrio parahaemolyticus]EGQ8335647.1 RES domain-containing protein [Vibrio parahaemolyticus]EJG0033960.1 RES family NAD+ phosphorylase [Vibrio parahaemolyticus]